MFSSPGKNKLLLIFFGSEAFPFIEPLVLLSALRQGQIAPIRAMPNGLHSIGALGMDAISK